MCLLFVMVVVSPALVTASTQFSFCAGAGLQNISLLYTDPRSTWPLTASQTSYQKFFINDIARLDQSTPGGLKQLVSTLGRMNIGIAVEGGGLRGGGNLARCNATWYAAKEFSDILPLIQAGYGLNPDSLPLILTMDGPFAHALHQDSPPCPYTEEQVVQQLLVYIEVFDKLALKAGVSVKYHWNEPVPWYRVGELPPYHSGAIHDFGDLLQLVDTVLNAGVRFDAFHADSPLEYNIAPEQGYEKLGQLMLHTRSRGLRFGKYFNSQEGGHSSGQAFHDGTLQDISMFLEHNGVPDDVIVESWYGFPRTMAPESQNYTFLRTVLDAYQKF